MRAVSTVFAKFMFWVENIFFILIYFFFELLMLPLVFLRVFYNIAVLSNFLTFLPLIILWIIIGPLYLLYAIFQDMFYFLKILCDYQLEEQHYRAQDEEEFKQDKIVIYNDVIDVMRSILQLFIKKKEKARSLSVIKILK